MTESSDLIAEQLSHALDLIKAENAQVKAKLDHESEVLRMEITTLKAWKEDAEVRLRSVQESATQYKLLASLATGGGLLSLIALLKVLTAE